MVLRDIPKLMDEPTLGLDVVAKRQRMDFLTRLNREKKVTILVTSQDMDDLEAMAQRILLISQESSGTMVPLRPFAGCPGRPGLRLP